MGAREHWMSRAADQHLLAAGKEMGFSLTDDQLEAFRVYREKIRSWNEKIDLTAIQEEREINNRHFLDSLSPFRLLKRPIHARLVDVGSGGGFPGLPMKIWDPSLELLMVDSLQKRVDFLQEVIHSLGIEGARAIHARAEDLFQEAAYRESFDLAISRALAPLPTLLEYCLPAVRIGGYFLAMKGPDYEEEWRASARALEILGGELAAMDRFSWTEEGLERTTICIKKVRPCPDKYPRGQAKARKKPL